MPDLPPATLGVLLAGGLARRMGGGDKPMRTVGGRTLLERTIARMMPQCDGLILNANGDPARFASVGLPVVPDTVDGFVGPMAGILAALEWTAVHRPDIEWVISAPADTPFLPRDLVARLQEARIADDATLAAAASAGQVHHVTGLWNVAIRSEMRRALVADDMRQVSRWTAQYKTAVVEWPAAPLDPFFNVNTDDDLATAERLAEFDG